jgi:carbohydrate diacid regulator
MNDLGCSDNIKLTSELAQTIINETMNIMEENRSINIRDLNGIVIASTNFDRINTCHKGATKAIETGKPYKLNEKEARKIPGAKPGIDQPIFFNNKILGVIGIIGDPDKLEETSRLIKMTVELMLQQVYYFTKGYLEEQAEENIIKEILNRDSKLSREIIKNKARTIGLDLDSTYTVMILEIINFWHEIAKEIGFGSNLRWQQYTKNIINKMIDFFDSETKIWILQIDIEKFVILKREKDKNNSELYGSLINWLEKTYKNFNFKLGICRGKELEGVRKSYYNCLDALDLGKKYYPDQQVYYIGDLILERMVKELSPQLRRELASVFPLKVHYQICLETFFSTDMIISETAQKLSLHRNSVIYRLDKIKEITGLDPKKFNDAIRLKYSLLCYKYGD